MRPFKPQISFRRAGSSRAMPCVGVHGHTWACQVIPCRAMCGGARAHVGVLKMLSHDHPCAFFVQVVHPWKPQISFGRFGSARPRRVESCRAMCGCPGTRGHSKNSKSSSPVSLLHIHAARFPDAPSGLRSGRAPVETPNFIRAVHTWKPQIQFEWVRLCRVWVPVQMILGNSSWFGSCRAVRGFSGTCGRAKNVKA